MTSQQNEVNENKEVYAIVGELVISGWRRRISSKIATGRRPAAFFSSGTTSLSQTSASGSSRRLPRGAFFWDGSRRSCSMR
jgi:hypothetical protein